MYTLKTFEEPWVEYNDGEIGKKLSASIRFQSLHALLFGLVFNKANINTIVLFLTILINPNSEKRSLASSPHYTFLKSMKIKAVKLLPLHIKMCHGD